MAGLRQAQAGGYSLSTLDGVAGTLTNAELLVSIASDTTLTVRGGGNVDFLFQIRAKTLGGAIGPAGAEGPRGLTGSAGPQGDPGAMGEMGDAGPAGADGAAGMDGDDGDDGWSPQFRVARDGERDVLEITSYAGGSGTPPPTPRYLSGVGLETNIANATNIRGDVGAIGPQGPTGPTGPAGPQGPAGAAGAAGAPGMMGAQGEQGPQGWSPRLGVSSDGERRVLRVVGWSGGGDGQTPPPSGFYLGSLGLTPDIAEGVDIRGPAGQGGGGVTPPVRSGTIYYGQIAGTDGLVDTVDVNTLMSVNLSTITGNQVMVNVGSAITGRRVVFIVPDAYPVTGIATAGVPVNQIDSFTPAGSRVILSTSYNTYADSTVLGAGIAGFDLAFTLTLGN